MSDDGNGAVFTPTRDMSPANWIPLNPSPGTTDRQVVAKAPAKIIDGALSGAHRGTTIELELTGRDLRLTLQWPGHDATGLAQFARAVLT